MGVWRGRFALPSMFLFVGNPSVKCRPGEWQVAHERSWLPDRAGSKNRLLPSASISGVRYCLLRRNGFLFNAWAANKLSASRFSTSLLSAGSTSRSIRFIYLPNGIAKCVMKCSRSNESKSFQIILFCCVKIIKEGRDAGSRP